MRKQVSVIFSSRKGVTFLIAISHDNKQNLLALVSVAVLRSYTIYLLCHCIKNPVRIQQLYTG
ncbi:hypothetical protein BFV94_3247 [Alteromonas macleodii]|uniref:Transposase n=1 Tax=Alteromonas macleodii TaxID=28108 RepID=A0AB36FW46_ALTMA|nr:hypothetical protein BFV93_3237 [Alteromonas macleodii]OES28892.1 hypothetical protein BFV94_3247 [Alteromonas macleodii]OES29210.1 hypothetical protein BFV95_3248 [Alteromonas macleodii]